MGAPVIAPAAGIVITTTTRAGYGLLLEVDHGRGIVTRYGHLSRVLVRVGQAVTRGQLLANVGSSGISTGPHLHYEIRVAGEVVDPLLFGP
jgi:murein DD-endopeptidase MepM/ murein hydrolase activator NlpD